MNIFRKSTVFIGCSALWLVADAATSAPPPPASPPLYAPGADALARMAAASSSNAANDTLAKRCKALIAANTPSAQMPPECKPFLPPPSVARLPSFTYSTVTITPNLVPRIPGGSPAPTPPPNSQPSAAEIDQYCKRLLAVGTPRSQLPPICHPNNAPTVPPAPPSGTPLCPDPSVFTHVRLIPCPPAPGTNQRPAGNPPTQPPSSTRPPASNPSPQPPRAPTPTPTPPPAVTAPPATPPVTAPPAPPAPSIAPPPAPEPPPAPPPTFTPPVPAARGNASQIPMGGGGAGVSPLSLPPPRVQTALPPPAPVPAPAVDTNEFEPAEVLVFAPFADSAQGALEIIANAGGTVLQQDALTQLEGLLLRVRANDGDAFRLATVLRQQLPQATVDLHGRLFLFPLAGSGSSGNAPRHYARAMLQLPQKPVPLAREVRVGVIDSGIERIGALDRGVGGEKSFMPNDANPADSVHGTAVAAMIAGYDEGSGFSGAAPGAKLYVARAMSQLPDGRSYTNAASVLRALDWLLAERVSIVNMSLGGRGDSTLAVGIAQAIRKGMLVVAAAGNGGPGAPASFPAALPDVVAVTALDVEAKLYSQANRGDYVMIAAPGVDVWAPQRAGGGSYVSGTSFASAWVSGALALVQAQRGDVGRMRWSTELCASAKDLGRGGRDGEFGCGLLQTDALLQRLK